MYFQNSLDLKQVKYTSIYILIILQIIRNWIIRDLSRNEIKDLNIGIFSNLRTLTKL